MEYLATEGLLVSKWKTIHNSSFTKQSL